MISVSVLVLVLVLLAVIWCYKRNNKPLSSCLVKLINKIFYNALIRYTLLNCLKLNMIASVTLFKTDNSISEIAQAGFILAALNILAILYSYTLCKHSESLDDQKCKNRMGTLYQELRYADSISNTATSRLVLMHPAIFMMRRQIFAIIAVILIDHPVMQMIGHQMSSLAYLIIMCQEEVFSSRSQKWIQIGTELTGLVVSTILMQLTRGDVDEYQEKLISDIFLSMIGFMILINIFFVFSTVRNNCRESKRLKNLLKKKNELIEQRKEQQRQHELKKQATASSQPLPLVEAVTRTSQNIPVGKQSARKNIKAVVKGNKTKSNRKSARGIKQLFTQKDNNILLRQPLEKDDESSVINESMLNHSKIVATAEKELAKT